MPINIIFLVAACKCRITMLYTQNSCQLYFNLKKKRKYGCKLLKNSSFSKQSRDLQMWLLRKTIFIALTVLITLKKALFFNRLSLVTLFFICVFFKNMF